MDKKRCLWVPANDELYVHYHDTEWGRPVHDDRQLFEMLILEGMQAGLSWIIVLRKREGYRKAFDNFDIDKILKYDNKKIEELVTNPDIIRHRLKITSVIQNAKAFRDIQNEFSSFDNFIWSYVDNKPVVGNWKTIEDMPLTTTPLSDKISKDLKKRGFKFVGSTIIYSFMQAMGMVNDHTTDCFAYKEICSDY